MPALIVDPELLAAVTRQFNLRGELQPFNLTENVVPIFDIGRLLALDPPIPTQVVTPGSAVAVRIGVNNTSTSLQVALPFFQDANIFDDTSAAPGAGTVLADTGQLTNNVQFMQILLSHSDGANETFEIQWRNAANNATLATLPVTLEHVVTLNLSFDTELNERVRIVNITAIAGTAATWIAVASNARAID